MSAAPALSSAEEARVLGGLLVIQSTLHVLPDEGAVLDFLCQAMREVPGVGQAVARRNVPDGSGEALAARPGTVCLPVRTLHSDFGVLSIQVSDPRLFGTYEPFVRNVAGTAAMVLENRLAQDLLRRHRDEVEGARRALEQRVAERTAELRELNLQLRADITERERAEEARQRSDRRFQAVFEQAAVGILMLDAQGRFLEANQRFAEIIGQPLTKLRRMGWRRLLAAEGDESRAEFIDAVASGACEHVVSERRYTRAAGDVVWANVTVSRVQDGEGPPYLLVLVEDTTARKQAEQRLAYLAHHDALTGLPNRTLLEDRFVQLRANARRAGKLVAMLFLDLDHFKRINDSLGHAHGDHLLCEIAERITGVLRAGDTVARLGGDEFVILIGEVTQPEDATVVAQKILDAVTTPLLLEGHEIVSTASLGIALYPDDGEETYALLRAADAAMYQAKQRGRDRYAFFSRELNRRLFERLDLESGLRHALAREEFRVVYQPKVDAASGRPTGVEALLRWEHPQHGLVNPAAFIPILEDTGLIVPISRWVLATACAQVMAWQEQGGGKLDVAVNISAHLFRHQGLLEAVRHALEESGMAPARLVLELTESTLMTDVDATTEVLRALKALGVRISIDDFGTGYSSLNYLKRFPIDELKIDRSFVTDITSDADDAVIASAIIAMAHRMGLRVVAEGIETEAQLGYLRRQGCDAMQGYYFGRPMDASALLEYLAARPEVPPATADRPALLIVDDEPNIRSALQRLLRGEGYRILAAEGGEQALELLALNEVAVVLSDERMPGMKGAELLARVRQLYPQTVRMMLTGYSDMEAVRASVNEGQVFKFITKPWDSGELRTEIRRAFRQHADNVAEGLRGG